MKEPRQNFSAPQHRGMGTFTSPNHSRQHPAGAAAGTSPAAIGKVNALDRQAAKQLLQFIGKPAIRIVLWDGRAISPRIDKPLATLHFNDRASLYLTLLRPELYWGDLYSEGRVEVDGDLVALLETVYRGMQDTERGWLDRLNSSLGHRHIRNTFRRAADNIHHHYDIGNDFYRLWLDNEAMQYTCAYYPDPAMTLEEAQIAKMSHVCRKLQLKPGDRVVEAGCGWGGFALYMAKNHGVTVKAYNISREQVNYAREKADAEGLADRVEYMLDDYRNIRGEYDVFVSVGMLEHVGPKDYPLLGQVMNDCLRPGGRGLIHSIGRNRPRPINAWIERRIFPGAYPPTLHEMMDIFETNRFSVLDVENLRLHYARTLAAWLERYEQNVERVEDMMDERFSRAWRLYLAGSRAAFTTGQLQLFQVLFAREEDNAIPWSRSHQYASNDVERAYPDV
ncbi:MAG TPA: cyclopropane-fatty-acyl-phospholipid synthase family protein [Xanthomonadales bacterium]